MAEAEEPLMGQERPQAAPPRMLYGAVAAASGCVMLRMIFICSGTLTKPGIGPAGSFTHSPSTGEAPEDGYEPDRDVTEGPTFNMGHGSHKVDADCKGYNGWAMACSVVSLVICLAAMFVPGLDARTNLISLFLLLWWIVGCGAMTFQSPFSETPFGNGYFGAWTGLVAAAMLVVQSWPQFSQPFKELSVGAGPAITVMTGGSIVVLVQIAVDCLPADNHPECKDGTGSGDRKWVIACSTVSIVAGLALMGMRSLPAVRKAWRYITAFLLAWWIAGVGVATLDAPYTEVGNGYFGCWAAVLAAGVMFGEAWGKRPENAGGDGVAESPASGISREVILLAFFSVIVLVRAVKTCNKESGALSKLQNGCDGYAGWAIASSSISLFVSLILVAARGGLDAFMSYVALFLFIWWVIAWYCNTFEYNPFNYPGNGFFGSWGAMLVSGKMVLQYPLPFLGGVQAATEEAARQRGEYLFMFLGGGVVMCESATWCSNLDGCTDRLGYAVVVGVLSMVFCLALLSPAGRALEKLARPIAVFLFLWWLIALCILTFDAPYTQAGNSFFGLWAGFIASALLLLKVLGFNVLDRGGDGQVQGNGADAVPKQSPGFVAVGAGEAYAAVGQYDNAQPDPPAYQQQPPGPPVTQVDAVPVTVAHQVPGAGAHVTSVE